MFVTRRYIGIREVNVDEVVGVERAVGGDRRQRRIADVPVEFDRQAPVLVLGAGQVVNGGPVVVPAIPLDKRWERNVDFRERRYAKRAKE